ncbi:hypothetical protein V8E36_003482 [Tilletia maclaganii]
MCRRGLPSCAYSKNAELRRKMHEQAGGEAWTSSPLSGVRERATRAKTRAPATRSASSAFASAAPKKSRFQLAKEAERAQANGQQQAIEDDDAQVHPQWTASHGEGSATAVPEPASLPLASADPTDEVWLDANGQPLSAFKKAMLQRKGQGPPGGIRPSPLSSSSSRVRHSETVPAAPTSQQVSSSSSASAMPQQTSTETSELDSISKENQAKVAAMSSQQVQSEVQELQDQIGSDLLEQFRQLALSRASKVDGTTSTSAITIGLSADPPSQLREAKTTSKKKAVSFAIPLSEPEPEPVPQRNGTSSSTIKSSEPQSLDEAVSALQFHEHTDVTDLDSFRITHNGMILSNPSAPGSSSSETYTISMLLSLVQSTAPAQRQLGFTILTRAISQSGSGGAINGLQRHLGFEGYTRRILRVAALAARYTLTDKHRSVATAARRCLLAVLSVLESGGHLASSASLSRASALPTVTSTQRKPESNKTIEAAGNEHVLLSNGEESYPPALQRKLVQSLPSSSAASLLVSDLVQSGLVGALHADVLACDRIVASSKKLRRPPSAAVSADGVMAATASADVQDALEGISETASICQILAQTSDLHAEAITEDHGEGENNLSDATEPLLSLLVHHGIRSRRWPPQPPAEPPVAADLPSPTLHTDHLDVETHVLSLVATIANSTPRAALKLVQQTNIANTLLRFIALPPWALSSTTTAGDEDDDDTEEEEGTPLALWRLRNWGRFGLALLAYDGLSQHSLEGALLDAWTLWLDVSEWLESASFLPPPSRLSNGSGPPPELTEARQSVAVVELRCASRALRLFGSWIERAVSSEGDFEDLTWTDVSVPTKEAALALLHKFAEREPGDGRDTLAHSGHDSVSIPAAALVPSRDTRSAAEKQRPTDSNECTYLLASAVELLTTWLNAAYESARNPARRVAMQVRDDAALGRLVESRLQAAATGALAAYGEEASGESGTRRETTLATAAAAQHETVRAIHELSRAIATVAPEPEGEEARVGRARWEDVGRRAGRVLGQVAASGYEADVEQVFR